MKPYSNAYGAARPRVQKDCTRVVRFDSDTGEEIVEERTTRTKQEFKDDCDIQKMMERFTRTGSLRLNPAAPMYIDTEHLPTFAESLQTVREVQQQFAGLPAKLRTRFENDPQEFVDWVLDPENQEEALELGFLQQVESADQVDELAEAESPPKADGSKEEAPPEPEGQ